MKKNLYILVLLVFTFSFISCEEVINVDLDTATPRLVIDAALKWEKGTGGETQLIKLSTTTGFFDQNIPTVSDATVFVTNSSGIVFDFVEFVPNTGEYICTTFVPVLNESYTLTVISNGMTYIATENLIPVPPIDKIEQNNDGGFGGGNIEVKFFYTDDPAVDNFYLDATQFSRYQIPQYGVSSDTFFQGNQIFEIYSNENIRSGDTIAFSLIGISEGYFKYLQVLLSIAGSSGGGPFQSPPATVRGNLVNTTDIENYALGFFSVSESTSVIYEVE